jgi:hypothetical protein
METFFAKDGAYLVLTFAVLSVPVAAAFIAYFWFMFRRDEMLVSLKRDLAAHGMSAEEILAVVEAVPQGWTDGARDPAALNGACSDSGKGTRLSGERRRAESSAAPGS